MSERITKRRATHLETCLARRLRAEHALEATRSPRPVCEIAALFVTAIALGGLQAAAFGHTLELVGRRVAATGPEAPPPTALPAPTTPRAAGEIGAEASHRMFAELEVVLATVASATESIASARPSTPAALAALEAAPVAEAEPVAKPEPPRSESERKLDAIFGPKDQAAQMYVY